MLEDSGLLYIKIVLRNLFLTHGTNCSSLFVVSIFAVVVVISNLLDFEWYKIFYLSSQACLFDASINLLRFSVPHTLRKLNPLGCRIPILILIV